MTYRPSFSLYCLSAICLLLAFLSACEASAPARDPRPNVVLLFTDELQFSDLGCYGGDIPTPHFDRLAAEGIRFTRAYTPASMCTPSRFAVLTGQFPGRCISPSFLAGIPADAPYSIAWNTWLTPETPTLPRILGSAGYFTGMAGKWHVSEAPKEATLPAFQPDDDPADPAVQQRLAAMQAQYEDWVRANGGFDYAGSVVWSNNDNHPIHALRFHNFPWMTKGALDFLDAAAQQEQPFFLYLTPTAIHGPNHVADLDRDVSLTPDGSRKDVLPYQLDVAKLKQQLAEQPGGGHRYAGIVQTDHLLGQLRQRLDSLGLSDNTIILFMSDHNVEPGKATSFEKGIHVPMIVYWPGQPGGRSSSALVENTDVLPTVLEAAGIARPAGPRFDGQSFLPVIQDTAARTRAYVFGENGYTRSVSNGRYKYIALRFPAHLLAEMESRHLDHVPSYVGIWPQAHSAIAMKAFPAYFDQDQFYDLAADPYELHNLADDPALAAVRQELQEALRSHLQTFDHPFNLEPVPFLSSRQYRDLQLVNQAYDLNAIPWYRRDHGGVQWPPLAE